MSPQGRPRATLRSRQHPASGNAVRWSRVCWWSDLSGATLPEPVVLAEGSSSV